MNDAVYKLLLSLVLFSHLSDCSASTKADVHYKVLYMNFVERLGGGGAAIPGFKEQILRIYSFFFLLDR